MTEVEKRAHPRVDFVAEVRLAPGDDAQVFVARNISVGGLFVEADPAAYPSLKVGTHVELRIQTRDMVGDDVICRAQISRVDQGGVAGRAAGFGVRFFRMDMANTMRVAKLVDRIRGFVNTPRGQ